MSSFQEIKKIESEVRSSKIYADWVLRNKSSACLLCDSEESLELHHIVELYQIVLGLWKVYREPKSVKEHCLSMHHGDRCECVTVCNKCHNSIHPSRMPFTIADQDYRVAMWCAVPRNLGFGFSLGSKNYTPNLLSLSQFQTMLGIGWHLINGQVEHRIVEFNRRKFAQLIHKTPGTSFNNFLENALYSLQDKGIILGHACIGNDMEIHLSPQYLSAIRENPWFMSLDDVNTSNMSTLVLRWFLSLQSNRKSYRICSSKLASNLGITTTTPSAIHKIVFNSASEIPWIDVSVNKDIFDFKYSPRGATPIHSLRAILNETLS